MKVKVLLITQWFDPEPTFKGLIFAKALVEQGFEVEVVTGFPNYPGGEVYDGYKIKFIQHEVIDGVNIARVPLYPSHDGSKFKRIFNYISFAASALFYSLFFAKKPDVIYAYHPPLTIGVVAVIVRFFRRVPVVYDIQDMWPDTLRSTGMLNNERALNIIDRVAKWVYKKVDQIVVLSPGFKRLLIERNVPEEKIEVIPNWCDEQSISSFDKSEIPNEVLKENRFKVLFAGNLGKAQSLDTVVNAAKILEKRSAEIVFIFLGNGVEVDSLKAIVSKNYLNNVIFLPRVSMHKVGNYLSSADVLLVHLKDDPLFSITIPSKTQAYMAASKPIIMGVKGDAADIIVEAKCGKVIRPENPEDLVDAVVALQKIKNSELRQLGNNAFNYYQEHLSLRKGVNSFTKIFRSLKGKLRSKS